MLEVAIKGYALEATLQKIICEFHSNGPVDPQSLETLALIKRMHNDTFTKYENSIVYAMGLFYKKVKPQSLLDEAYSIFADTIVDKTGELFTPVQASAYEEISDNKYFSFSAPTSSGKSYLFRSLIRGTAGDIVIVVPSRALISEYYYDVISLVENDVLVLQFIDNINTSKITRRVFIITPERGPELFQRINEFNIELFLLDEAQISEEEVRGMRFDSFVRRIDKHLPYAKKIFAHPFVKNPEAQLIKHGFLEDSSFRNYEQQSVGKIFVAAYGQGRFKYFSPNTGEPQIPMREDFVERELTNGKTLLVYISKDKIYEGRHLVDFRKYVQICQRVENGEGRELIEKLREFIGAKRGVSDKYSLMIDMMDHGIVIHHGSMPLKARLMIEHFIRKGFARICFATSTLNQGINMPFDMVWIDNFNRMQPLTLKNLIGRSGRSSKNSQFDYGYTIINKANVSLFSKRYSETYSISETSRLDLPTEQIDEDLKDIVEAIREDKFNDELRLTVEQVERLKTANLDAAIKFILDNLLSEEGKPLTGKAYYTLAPTIRKRIKSSFKDIFVSHLRRTTLNKAESSALSAAIPIMLWHVQGKSFSEIVSLRHAYLTKKDDRRAIQGKLKTGQLTAKEADAELQEIKVEYSQIPFPLPNASGAAIPLFRDTLAIDADYDRVVFDTYDYLDKVISLSLVDPICGAIELYSDKTGDERAAVLVNYLRYGTDDSREIWLLRYGFGFDDIEWIIPHLYRIDETGIQFLETIRDLSDEKKEVIHRYL